MTEPTTEAKAQAYERVMEVLNTDMDRTQAGRELANRIREAARIQPTESQRLEKAVAIANERVPDFLKLYELDDSFVVTRAVILNADTVERLLGIDQ